MTQKILVPLDGSALGEAVLPKLENLVLKTMVGEGIEVTLLRVVSTLNFNMLTDNDAAQLPISPEDKAEATAREQAYLDSLAAHLKWNRVTVRTMISFGHAAEEIVKAGRALGANLIAMSTRGHSGVVRWAIGSVTDSVIRLEGEIPVLAVHASEKSENQVLPMGSLRSLVHPSHN